MFGQGGVGKRSVERVAKSPCITEILYIICSLVSFPYLNKD